MTENVCPQNYLFHWKFLGQRFKVKVVLSRPKACLSLFLGCDHHCDTSAICLCPGWFTNTRMTAGWKMLLPWGDQTKGYDYVTQPNREILYLAVTCGLARAKLKERGACVDPRLHWQVVGDQVTQVQTSFHQDKVNFEHLDFTLLFLNWTNKVTFKKIPAFDDARSAFARDSSTLPVDVLLFIGSNPQAKARAILSRPTE